MVIAPLPHQSTSFGPLVDAPAKEAEAYSKKAFETTRCYGEDLVKIELFMYLCICSYISFFLHER